MGSGPRLIDAFDFSDSRLVVPRNLHGDGKPFWTTRAEYQVAISPVAPSVLHLVEED